MAFLSDTFTDTDGVLLENHTPDVGGAWSKVAGAGQYKIDSNKLTLNSGFFARFRNTASPTSPEYDVTIVVNATIHNGWVVAVLARHIDENNKYMLYHQDFSTESLRKYVLQKVVSGSTTTLATFNESFPSGDQTVKAEILDTTKKLFVGGVEKISTADNELTDKAAVGLWLFGSGWTVDNLLAEDVSAEVTGAAVLTGVGSLVVAAGVTIPGSAALNGVGTLAAAGTIGVIQTGAAVLSGVGSLTPGTPVLTLAGQASFLGEGSLVAVGERGVLGVVALAGVGDMSAIGEIGGTLEGRAALAGVGSMSAIGERIVTGQVALAGAGAMSATGVLVLTGIVALSGVGSLAAIGESGAILYTQMGKRVYEFDASVDYPPDALFYFEANLEVLVGVGKVAAARLYNITDAGEVTGSEILIPGPGPEWDRSGSFSLPSGVKRYRIEYGGASGGEYKPHGAALRVESS